MYVISLLPSRASSAALQVTWLLLTQGGSWDFMHHLWRPGSASCHEGSWAESVALASLDPYSHFITMPDFLYWQSAVWLRLPECLLDCSASYSCSKYARYFPSLLAQTLFLLNLKWLLTNRRLVRGSFLTSVQDLGNITQMDFKISISCTFTQFSHLSL